ncbi:MAG: HlyD family secretion protein, partial [Blastocatellia bacterium]
MMEAEKNARVFLFKKTIAFVALALLTGAGLLAVYAHIGSGRADETPATTGPKVAGAEEVTLACPGRVEGESELIEVGSGIDGVLGRVLVKDGQNVVAGQTLAVIDRADVDNDLKAATALADSARQVRKRLIDGSREEERRGANADTAAAEAVSKQAELTYRRIERLFEESVVSTDARDQARRDMEVAQAKVRSAANHERLVNETPLPEELAKADADVRAADDAVAHAKSMVEKCSIKAPISGTVLRCDMKPGESVSTVFPKPILTMADASGLR